MGMRLAALAGVLAACAASADADWVHDMLLEDCSTESRNRLEASVRQNIESSVRRAEASIEAPASIGDLGCLDGLMDVDIDVFASVGPLSSVFSNSLDGLLTGPAGSKRICRFAHRKWNEVTRPLRKPLEVLQAGLPPDFSGSFNSASGAAAQEERVGEQNRLSIRADPASSGANIDAGSERTGWRSPASIEDIWRILYGRDDR